MAANFGSHALLHERTELALIVDLDDLLRPIGRVGNVELHLDSVRGAARSRQRRCLSTGRFVRWWSFFKARGGFLDGARVWCSENSAVWVISQAR